MTGLIASRNYSPGDLIYSEETFAQVVRRKFIHVECESCGKRSIFLKSCTQCSSVKYCGKTCQKKDWYSHKLECKYLKNLPEDDDKDFLRLLGKVILKIKDKKWRNVKKRVLGKDISFDDIDSHYRDMTENPRTNLQYKELKTLLTKYIGKENMPSDIDLIRIVGKVKFSCYLVDGKSIFFSLGLNMFDAECIPNSNISLCGTVLKIWANKKISKGIDKITIPTKMILSATRFYDRPKDFPCKCTDCSSPYGESILSKIINEEKAFSVIKQTENLLQLAKVFGRINMEEELRENVDELLKRQEGVLGNTNQLRLELMALRYLQIGDHALFLINPLKQLEKYMSSVFGEHSLEMEVIYATSIKVYGRMGDALKVHHYITKVDELEYHERKTL